MYGSRPASKLPLVAVLGTTVVVLVLAASAGAACNANDAEFGEIAAAIPAEDLDGGYFCPAPDGTWISALDPSWALVEMRGNCGRSTKA